MTDLAAPRRRLARPPAHLADLTVDERRAAVTELGMPAFRAEQISRAYFTRLADPVGIVDAMTDVPVADRAALAAALAPEVLSEVRHLTCDDGWTVKSLWRAHDGNFVESVVMRYPNRATVCVSSQVGCGMACPFCATGQGGLTRNMSAAEIVEQVVAAARLLRSGAAGEPMRLSNVVFMGMGEPLANYRPFMTALRALLAPSPSGLGLSARGITVSSVGLVPAIRRFLGEKIPVTLAVSLHAPDDELRDSLVPVNLRFPISEVMDVIGEYASTTGRRVSIEYALIRDVNDQLDRAHLLGRLLRGTRTHVNLIPLDPTPGSKWDASSPEQQQRFVDTVASYRVPVTVRDTRGREIDGACGQLAAAARSSSPADSGDSSSDS
jgi:23S rRNA (adenine2503-C2)-methyltransferase